MTFIKRVKRKLLPPREVIQGYENPELVETIFLKTINYNPDSDWPLVAGINTVLDFGGGAGLHYKVARRQCPDIRWAVVETPAMVQRAKELGTDRLMFFERIDQAADWLGTVDLIHSNGTIQYVPDALETVRTLCSVRPAMFGMVPRSDQRRDPARGSDLVPERQRSRIVARLQGEARQIRAQLDLRASIHPGS
ncbi:hypothetical protein ACVW0J_001128 [Bradyrhizobium sp. i1.7.7]